MTAEALPLEQRGIILHGLPYAHTPRAQVNAAANEQVSAAYGALLRRCAGLEPIVTAIVHPCDSVSLAGAIDAAEAVLIVPVLVGPAHKVGAVAEHLGLDIRPYRVVDVPHSHAAASGAVEA